MMTPQEMVAEFHRTFKSPEMFPENPGTTYSELEVMRIGLISEEYKELMDAYEADDFIEVVDALADMVYVIYGFAWSVGVDLDACLEEVHRSNMTKLDDDGEPIFREDGKIMKSDNFEAPDLARVIFGGLRSLG